MQQLRAFVASYWTPAGRRALTNLIGLAVCTFVSQLCGFGVLLVLTGGLGPEGFGTVVFALNVQYYLVSVGTGGLVTVVVRELSRAPELADSTITGFATTAGALSAAVGLLFAAAVLALPLGADERALLLLIAVVSVFASLNLSPVYDGFHRQSLAAALMLPGDVLAVAALALLHRAGVLTVPLVGVVLVAKNALTLAVQSLVLNGFVRRVRWAWDRRHVAAMVRAGWPMMIAGLTYAIPLQGGVILVRVLRSETETAVYGLAFQLASVYFIFGFLFVRVLQPHIAGPYGADRRFVVKLVAVLAAFHAALLAGAYLVAVVIVAWFLDPLYEAALSPLALLLFAAMFASVGWVANAYLLRAGAGRRVVWAYAAGGILFLAAAGGLIPTFGGIGAAWASAAAAGLTATLLTTGAVTAVRAGTA